jgi:nucleotide-binding universal stress UspA family protein
MKTKTQKSRGARGRIVAPALKEKTFRRKITPVIDLVPSLLKIKSILVPMDFSAPSKKALAYAVPFAEQFGAKLTLLHVVEPVATPDFANSFPLVIEDDKMIAACKGRLERIIKEQAIDLALVENALVRYGRSFHEIADAARTLRSDLIIISTHGYTGLKRAVLGSTTERVVRHAPCPVLVVREHEREFA